MQADTKSLLIKPQHLTMQSAANQSGSWPNQQHKTKHCLHHQTAIQKDHDHIATWQEQRGQQQSRTAPMGACEAPSVAECNPAAYQQSSQVEQKLQNVTQKAIQ
jgi:hypothetical protein